MNRALLLLALLAVALSARAQSAVDLYHEAARLYVGDDLAAAEAAAERGLRLAPDDPKLRALLDRIRQQEQSGQGNQSNQQSNPNQQGGGEGQESNEGERDPQPGEQDDDQPQDDGEGTASDRPQEEPAPPEQAGQPQPGRDEAPRPDALRPGEGEPTPESAMPVAPGEMTRAEAERILNAVGAEERLLLRRVQRQTSEGRRVEKDW